MSRSTRRGFIQQSAALGIGLGLAAGVSGKTFAANDKISVACIGVRGRGNSVMHSFAAEPDCEITHLCDVREPIRRQRGAEMKQKTGRAPTLVNDYRDLLNDKSIDVFMVATPDHWHALLTIEGCLAGKDVYVEKPASHNILEGKTAVAAARKRDRMVQMGTQIRSAPFLQEAIEYVKSGALGKVIYGKAWETSRNGAVHLPQDGEPPTGLDYEIWQGPAPERPYNSSIVGNAWRWLFDYGTGDLGNDGVHRIDYCRHVMGLDGMPEAISCSGGKFFFEDDQQWPDTMLINYEYPGKVLQYEMRLWSRAKLHGAGEGATIYGENGWVLLTNTSWKAYDAAGKLVKQGSSDVGQQAHIRNFLDAVRSRKRDSLNQEIYSGHVSTLMCHAGNISWRTGKKLRLDSQTETFDDKEANQYVGREHRKGFELPKIG
ncbi:MAG: Gfo/Idh/MocA family oxidoreductase [Planctomycetota bacterium]|jgi:predicted dehydrogenase|nr:Gfo/Idh/MocA family oxidoreductase [Planctomycetota bacterium]MDP7302843.1 Gfo/Idh/MocA family oxidoreductase [Pirellulaceae bacterium]HJN13530.1 Gfo/Idh/MocA family oxidoreductase [Pirellulaceae bacterium]